MVIVIVISFYSGVDVKIDGKSFEFLIDSGASPTLISEDVRKQLGLPLLPGMKLGGVAAGGATEAQRVGTDYELS